MTIGEVTPNKEAVVKQAVFGPQGQQQEVSAILDTGYTEYLTLPPPMIADLGLPYQYSLPMYLADDNPIRVRVFDGVARWKDQERHIPVQETEGDVLLGMSLLYGARLVVEVLDGGDVTVSEIP